MSLSCDNTRTALLSSASLNHTVSLAFFENPVLLVGQRSQRIQNTSHQRFHGEIAASEGYYTMAGPEFPKAGTRPRM
jgi:hypothetical protein